MYEKRIAQKENNINTVKGYIKEKYGNKYGYKDFEISVRELQDLLKVSDGTIHNYIKELETNNFIQQKFVNKGSRFRIMRLVEPSDIKISPPPVVEVVQNKNIEDVLEQVKEIIDKSLVGIKVILDEAKEEVRQIKIQRDNALAREKALIAKLPSMVEERVNIVLKRYTNY